MQCSGRGLLRRHVIPLAGVLCLCVGWPLLLAVLTGSLAIPHNDSWAHSLIAQHYARSGSVELVGWPSMALVGQIIVLGPLGASLIAQQLFVAVLASVGLLATYGVLMPRVGRNGALLGTAVVGLTPEFGLLATSYMTDIPAYTAVVGCLFLTDQALRTQDARYLVGALVVGTWGVTVREQAIVGPVIAVVVTVAAWRGTKRWIAVVGGVLSALVILGFEAWRRSLPHGYQQGMSSSPRAALPAVFLICACFTLALAVFPAVLVTAQPHSWSRRARRIGATALVVVVLVVIEAVRAYRLAGTIFLANYLDQEGAYKQASVGVRSVLPDWWWVTLVVMAGVSLVLIVGHFVDSGVSLDRISGLVLLLVLGGILAQSVVGGLYPFAKYLLVAIPFACVPFLRNRAAGDCSLPRRRNWLLSLLALAGLAATSTAITANALAFDAARWQAASSLVARGVAATDIDAGIEWVGYHASEPASWSSAHTDALSGSGYMRMFEHSRECYVISASPLHGLSLVATAQYRTYALAGSSKLWVYRVTPCR